MIRGIVLLMIFSFMGAGCKQHIETRLEKKLDFGWKFSLENNENAFLADFDDTHWREVNLPHDWSVEFPFDSVKGEGATGYLPGGIGWYRKNFSFSGGKDRSCYVLFDGVYNNSEVWINGKKLGEHPYGYSPFYFDLTPHLKDGEKENVIAVKVDRSRYVDSRWYTGSGIYRHVKLIDVNNLHIPVWGSFVTTPVVSDDSSKVQIDLEVRNKFPEARQFYIQTSFFDPSGNKVAEVQSSELDVDGGASVQTSQNIIINAPQLWDVEQPNLYKAVSHVVENGVVVDDYTTTFGIRSFRFDAEKGFFLNGKNIKIKGVCLHHDGGLVGAAVPEGVWKRRLETLKEAGCNAIRVSHNPASTEFLELCDEMGFLVQDEFFDEWDYPKDKRLNMHERHNDYISRGYAEHFQQWAEFDLKNTMLAHRNHPSIFQWSIGNEIEWTYPRNKKSTGFFDNMSWSGNYFWSQPPYSPEKINQVYHSLPAMEYEIGATARKLAGWTRELDTTRPVIANCILPSVSFESGYADALDIVGFSYRRVMYDYARKNYPKKIVMGTESLPQWHEWKAVEERPFVSGTFLWTGIDYMGEANGQWPKKGIESGLLDLAGFKKPAFHMYKTLWNDKPHIYMCSRPLDQSRYKVNSDGKVLEKKQGSWKNDLWEWAPVNEHWNYEKGEKIVVQVFSNCPEVELYLNGKSLGVKALSQFPDRKYKWVVPYEKGELVARGISEGQTSIKTRVVTSGKPSYISLSVDNNLLNADGCDVAHVVAQVRDKEGNPVFHCPEKISFKVEGAVKSLGVDNGDIRNTQFFKSDVLSTYKGRALLIVEAKNQPGDAIIKVAGAGLKGDNISLTVR